MEKKIFILELRIVFFQTEDQLQIYSTFTAQEIFAGKDIYKAIALDICIKLTYMNQFREELFAKFFNSKLKRDEKISLISELIDVFHNIETRKIGGASLSHARYFRLIPSRVS